MTDEEKAAAELAEKNEDKTTEINDDDLLAAVSAAVDEQTIKPEKKDDDTDDSTDDVSELADADADEDAEPKSDDEPKGEEAEDKDESEDGESEDGGDAAEKDAGKTKEADKDASDEGTDDADHVNDPIPESTNEKTATRIKSLIGLVKDGNQATEQRDEIMDQINATGADADQYANTLGFLQLYNSTDPAQRKQALAVARGLVKELALDLGEGASVTQLSDHDDLQAEVEAGTLTEKRAIEIAATRERQTMDDARTEAANNKTETANQTQANIQVGKTQLDDLETGLRATHPDYADLRPMFVGVLKSVLKRTHPSEWGVAAREVFDQVRAAHPTKAAPKPKPKPVNEPLRPGGGGAGGGADKEVDTDSALGAVNDALANM